MALTNEELQDIIDNLTPEQLLMLQDQLNSKIQADEIIDLSNDTDSEPISKIKPKAAGSEIYCCVYCGSASYKKHGTTNKGMRRYICNDCGKCFSENHFSGLRYSHLSKKQLMTVLNGISSEHSLKVIAKDSGLSVSTVWSYRMKVNQAIMDMYGYSDLFQGVTEADEYYCHVAFKGKRDPEFFIYILGRMPRHHMSQEEKIEWLEKNNLYDRLLDEDPDYLMKLVTEDPKIKRGISNDQICVLTLTDLTGKLYLEPVSVGRLEKAMAKAKLKQRFIPDKNNVFVTDGHTSYRNILYGTGATHIVLASSKHTKGKYSLTLANSIHGRLDKYMNLKAGKVYNVKYVDLTLMLFWWLFKYREHTTEEKAEALYKLMIGEMPDMESANKVRHVTIEELTNREITLDTKGCFPTKL